VRSTPPAKGTDAVLACELTDFTEWDGPGTGDAHVALTCLLHASDASAPRSFAAEGRVATPRATAAGMAEALAGAARQAIDTLADDVAAALAQSSRR
jgi:hypothetical protein